MFSFADASAAFECLDHGLASVGQVDTIYEPAEVYVCSAAVALKVRLMRSQIAVTDGAKPRNLGVTMRDIVFKHAPTGHEVAIHLLDAGQRTWKGLFAEVCWCG